MSYQEPPPASYSTGVVVVHVSLFSFLYNQDAPGYNNSVSENLPFPASHLSETGYASSSTLDSNSTLCTILKFNIYLFVVLKSTKMSSLENNKRERAAIGPLVGVKSDATSNISSAPVFNIS